MSNKSGTSSQAITLPSGGGAIQGIGETFSPDPFTGTGNFTVPISVPAGRNGFQPELSLGYSSGNGNGPFGLGWSLSVPNVSRKTSSGVPRYRDTDADPAERDTFVLAGDEDLVAVAGPAPDVTRFRPRTEVSFARIDRVSSGDEGYVWRVSARDGLVSRYGATLPGHSDAAVVADPADRAKVFRWNLCETVDPFGNRIEYEYRRDTGSEGPHRWDQLYLERIRYVDHRRGGATRFLISVTFVYEERPDPFSDHRAGFEIRTRLRCRRIEVHTHPPSGTTERDLLTRSYELEYLDDLVRRGERPAADLPRNGTSLLCRIRVVGHDGAATQELPPIELGYSRFAPERQRFQPIEGASGTLPPVSLGDDDHETVDLFGNGLPDIVELNGSARFWRNRGGGRFDAPRAMDEVPAGVRLRDPGVQFADMNGDGRADLLVLPQRGYFPLAFGGRWSQRGFVRYRSAPTVDFGDDELRLVDLTGDGVVDALRTGERFELFFNNPHTGWDRVETRQRGPITEFPNVSFSDSRVKLADMNGDGLQDIVLVDQGRIDYWPYLGHGRWGRRVTMDSSPVFRDTPPVPGGFDPRRVLFGDLDGDGLDDVVYVQANRLTLWINQGGEGWSEPVTVEGTPRFTDVDGVRLTDMLGTGMSGVLWTADRVTGGGSHYQFLDLTGGLKPHLLKQVDNHRGAVTRIRYASSTAHYLADEARPETRWKTPLPFPVHVVDRVETIDTLSGGKLTNVFRYHHGYWDGVERELRGFGLVEQLDTESFEDFHGARPGSAPFVPVTERQFSPPTLTRTWFHQGPVGDEFDDRSEPDRSAEYWPDDSPVLGHVEGVNRFLATLPTRRDRRDALRALAGSVLRIELYANDSSEHQARPYTVTEVGYGLREESRPGEGDRDRRRVFFPHRVATRTSQWERGVEPMTSIGVTDDYDAYGQSRRQLSLAVPRGRDFRASAPAAEPYLGTVTSVSFAQRDDAERFVVDRVARTTTHELVNDGRQSVFALRDAVRDGTAQLEVIGQALTYFDGPAFEGLPFGRLGEFGAPVRSETLVLTEATLGDDMPPYLRPDRGPTWPDEYPDEFRLLLAPLAGYSFSAGDATRARGWFAQHTRRRYDFHDDAATGHGLVQISRDALGRQASVRYDNVGLLPVGTTDAAGLSSTAVNDYRVLQAQLTTDANGNRTAYAFTPLGLLERVAVMGKEGETLGDTLSAPGTRYVYDLLATSRSAPGDPRPVSVRTIRRVHHVTQTAVPPAQRTQTLETVGYSDGFGRMIQTRARAEDEVVGDVRRGADVLPVDQDDPATQREVRGRRNRDAGSPNVVVSGWQVYDNKGRVVERYQPFFATGWDFAPVSDAQLGQRLTMFYEPLGRVVRTVNPDGSEQRTLHGVPIDLTDPERVRPTPWELYSYDHNDNAARTHDAEAEAEAEAYLHHTDTPTNVVVDALGRAVTTIQRTRPPRRRPSDPLPPIEELRGHASYDIRGNPIVVTDAAGRQAFRHRYDLMDRPWRTENIDAGVQQMVFDAAGQQVERRDGKGALTLQAYDVLNRPTRLWARDDGTSPVGLRGRLEYGDAGDPAQPSAERAAARAANQLGALVRHYDEAGLVTVDQRDFKHNVLQRTRQVVAEEQILGVFPAANDPAPDWDVSAFRIDWEPAADETLDERAGRLLDATRYTTSDRYDALNRLQTQRCPSVDGDDGEGRELQLAYDRSGALAQVSLDGDVVVERIAYNADGQRTLVALGNGVMTRFAYDPRTLRLARMRAEAYTKPASDGLTYRPVGAPRQDLVYRYDLVGNLLGLADRTPGCGVAANPAAGSVKEAKLRALVAAGDALVRGFAYDPLYRLVSATGRECRRDGATDPWSDPARCGFGSGNHGTPDQDNAPSLTGTYRQEFSYDPVGNLLRLTHTGATSSHTRTHKLVAGSNRLRRTVSGQTTIPYSYDAVGNLVAEATSRHFEWDHGNRLKAFRTQTGTSEPSVHAQYLYGANGARVRKVVRKQGGDVEVTTYVDAVFEHQRWGHSGQPGSANTTVHVIDGQERVARVRTGPAHPDDHGPARQYIQGDHLGSGSVTSDESGGFVNREEFTPYGETSFGSFGRKRYRFCGRERDAESGLSSHGARYYAPYLARWTSTDPDGPVDGANLYTYCRANPLVLVDPTGRNPQQLAQVKGEFALSAIQYELGLADWVTIKGELDDAMNAMDLAQMKLSNALPGDPEFMGPDGFDEDLYNRARRQYYDEWREARGAYRATQSRLIRVERRLAELPNELKKLEKQYLKLGGDIDDLLDIYRDAGMVGLFGPFGESGGGGGGGGNKGGGGDPGGGGGRPGGGGAGGGPAGPAGGSASSGSPGGVASAGSRGGGGASRGSRLARSARWAGRGVKAAKSVGTLGAGLVTGEIATRLCTPRDMSEGQRAGFAAVLGFVPPGFDIAAACSLTFWAELYRPISDYAYSQEDRRMFERSGATAEQWHDAHEAWRTFQAGKFPSVR